MTEGELGFTILRQVVLVNVAFLGTTGNIYSQPVSTHRLFTSEKEP